MKTLPPGFLSKKGGRWRELRMLDAVTLLHNIHMGATEERVGFEDAQETLESITKKLSKKKFLIEPSILESALWSCNLMNEIGCYWDADGRAFDDFVRQLLGRDGFNRFYNVIEGKDSE